MFDKKGYILNGQFISFEQDSIEISNRAFLYGDTIFETMFANVNRIHFFSKHMERLIGGMKVLKYQIPPMFTDNPNYLEKGIFKLMQKNKIFGQARVRLSVFRKSGGFYSPDTNEVDYIINAQELAYNKFILNKNGLTSDVFDEIKKPINIFSSFKISNSLLYVMSGLYNQSKNIDESLILNEKGFIIETTTSNIFTVINDEIFTPPVSEGCINGIMRMNIIQIAKEQSIKITEKPLKIEDILRAEEVFLSNAVKGIQWIVAFRQKRFYKKMSEFLVGQLNEKLI